MPKNTPPLCDPANSRLHRTGSEAAALFSKPVRKKSVSVIPAGLANLPSRETCASLVARAVKPLMQPANLCSRGNMKILVNVS